MWRTSFQIWKSERSVLLVNAVTIWPLAPNAAEAEYPDLDLNQGLDLRRVQCYPLHHRDLRDDSKTMSPFAPRKWRCFRGAKGD